MAVTYQAEAGKGSRQRPVEVETYQSNWDKIFGDKNKKPEVELCRCCHNERGVWDCGYWYECTVCSK